MTEQKVSGNIYITDYGLGSEEEYVIRSPITGQGWGLPVKDITSKDLRVLADRLDEIKSAADIKEDL